MNERYSMINEPVVSKNYYEILGVDRSATAEEIKAAYRKQALKVHPDVAHDNENAKAEFQSLLDAYETLKDDNKRRRYNSNMGVTGPRIVKTNAYAEEIDLKNLIEALMNPLIKGDSCYDVVLDLYSKINIPAVKQAFLDKLKRTHDHDIRSALIRGFKSRLDDDVKAVFLKELKFSNNNNGVRQDLIEALATRIDEDEVILALADQFRKSSDKDLHLFSINKLSVRLDYDLVRKIFINELLIHSPTPSTTISPPVQDESIIKVPSPIPKFKVDPDINDFISYNPDEFVKDVLISVFITNVDLTFGYIGNILSKND